MQQLSVLTERGPLLLIKMSASPSLVLFSCKTGIDDDGSETEYQVVETVHILSDYSIYRGEMVIALGTCPYGESVNGMA
jgi:hypothetical protein